ncbi:hypothetical protein NE236_41880 [Actinoallomurus purpureus]|uniref:hypothetical protein n=1 Tax=Actinoallomurus purpureus TaxID=478114 RepID=UPI0020931A2C|nr:hypothetical protein [Actinoallomurus purpureus]MCO6011521.1 hypothetical protein [Actinoallomurus purpureus]
MTPAGNPRIWRKNRRKADRGIPAGRRTTHRAKTEEPTPGSTWMRRHPGELPPYILRRHPGALKTWEALRALRPDGA